jgi:hypothetical protein
MTEEYQDERYCEHCGDYTIHKCRDSGHERDSSGDRAECQICHWYYCGLFGKYMEPFNWEIQ